MKKALWYLVVAWPLIAGCIAASGMHFFISEKLANPLSILLFIVGAFGTHKWGQWLDRKKHSDRVFSSLGLSRNDFKRYQL
jgi:hypothetical protein